MKLCTDILPRRDGTVIAPGAGKAKFTFEDHGDGVLSCEVSDEASLALLLSTEHFYPFSDEDIGAALALTGTAGEPGADAEGCQAGVGADPDDELDDELDGSDDLGEDASGAALPVEAGTPPVPSSKGGRKRSS